jgi:hypothetical protein
MPPRRVGVSHYIRSRFRRQADPEGRARTRSDIVSTLSLSFWESPPAGGAEDPAVGATRRQEPSRPLVPGLRAASGLGTLDVGENPDPGIDTSASIGQIRALETGWRAPFRDS